MDCCSKCPPTDYRLHSTMFSSGRMPPSMSASNNDMTMPSGFYNHLHSAPMRYPHSMYRLTAPCAGAGYNVIGPPPTTPSSLSSASSVSSNSSISPSSHSPASPNLYPAYERYGNYGNFPPYGYRSRDADTASASFNYTNLNHRLDMNSYYSRPYDSYNRYAASFAYRNSPIDYEMLNNRAGSMGYNSPYGRTGPAELRSDPNFASSSGRYHHYQYGRSGTYDTHPFSYLHFPRSLNRGFLRPEPIHPHINRPSSDPHMSPALSNIGAGSRHETSTYENQSAKAAFCSSDTAPSISSLANGKESCDSLTNNALSHLHNSTSTNELPYHMRPETPYGMLRQQHDSAYEVKEEKVKKTRDKDRCLKRHNVQHPDSPARQLDRAETPCLAAYQESLQSQTNLYPANQNFGNRLSPYSTGSPYSWTEQYSPKPVRRRPPDTLTSSSDYVNKNRVLECDFIPSKKSRKKIKTEDIENSPEMREEIKDITPLPGFQQAFGSTEIGRFSETFLNTPERIDYFCESEPDTFSPQPWETGDSLEGPHYNLHIGATVVQPDIYSENHSSTDSPIEKSYFSEMQCSDF